MVNNKKNIEAVIILNRNFIILIIINFKQTDNLVKWHKKVEALQELMNIQSDFKGKKVYFFSALDKYFEGVLLYNVKEKKAYVYSIKNGQKYESFSKWITGLKKQGLFKGDRSALKTIFLESSPTSKSIASILRKSDYIPYWKPSNCANI
ncbi:hypothetical protein C1645_813872 [Glomus cerebriforme]|uniref:Uncharacterized protein n=1 Tax=Glomus cerebriforme TaxID=658196 RepID=A0A397THA6_9GLOM|nr:hypothetical protein C1645_813872 [Glomus cerebriforme]